MEQETTLTHADWRLMDIVWDHEPVDSPQPISCRATARADALA